MPWRGNELGRPWGAFGESGSAESTPGRLPMIESRAAWGADVGFRAATGRKSAHSGTSARCHNRTSSGASDVQKRAYGKPPLKQLIRPQEYRGTGTGAKDVRKSVEAVEKLPPVSESLRCAKNLYFHYYTSSSFFLSLYFGPRIDGSH